MEDGFYTVRADPDQSDVKGKRKQGYFEKLLDTLSSLIIKNTTVEISQSI